MRPRLVARRDMDVLRPAPAADSTARSAIQNAARSMPGLTGTGAPATSTVTAGASPLPPRREARDLRHARLRRQRRAGDVVAQHAEQHGASRRAPPGRCPRSPAASRRRTSRSPTASTRCTASACTTIALTSLASTVCSRRRCACARPRPRGRRASPPPRRGCAAPPRARRAPGGGCAARARPARRRAEARPEELRQQRLVLRQAQRHRRRAVQDDAQERRRPPVGPAADGVEQREQRGERRVHVLHEPAAERFLEEHGHREHDARDREMRRADDERGNDDQARRSRREAVGPLRSRVSSSTTDPRATVPASARSIHNLSSPRSATAAVRRSSCAHRRRARGPRRLTRGRRAEGSGSPQGHPKSPPRATTRERRRSRLPPAHRRAARSQPPTARSLSWDTPASSGQPRQRRALRVPPHRRRHGRRAARVRAQARGRRPRARRARASRAGGALPRARGHDEVPARAAGRSSPGRARPSSCPPGRVHRFANGGESGAGARRRSSPRWTWSGCWRPPPSSRREGNATAQGMPKPLHLRCSSSSFRREVRAPFPPAPDRARAMSRPRSPGSGRKRGHGAALRRDGRRPSPPIVAVTA